MSAYNFTPVPATRAIGQGNPPQDMDNTSLGLEAAGGYLNAWNTAFSGGADPTGSTDSTASLNAMLTACPAGLSGVLPSHYVSGGTLYAATYKTTAPLTPPPGVGLVVAGITGQDTSAFPGAGAVIKPSGAFSGGSVIYIADVGAAITEGGVFRGFGINGSSLPGTTDGIQSYGPITKLNMRDVAITACTGWGINQTQDSGASGNKYAYGWRVNHCLITNCAGGGAQLPGHTDSIWNDVHAIGCAGTSGHGFLISGSPSNSHFTNCRSEWAGTGDGYHLTGSWNTGSGSGPFTMTGCSTDRNQLNGLYSNATGYAPVMVSNCTFRRDGRNSGSGGGGYAGIQVSSATIPMFFNPVCVFPGVDDNGGSTESPQYGASVASSTTVQILSGYLQGATAGTNGTTASAFLVAPNVIVASGTTGGPATNLTDFYRQAASILQTDNAIQAPNSFISAKNFNPGGITGAGAQCRFVGAIASGTQPASGTFQTGDVVIIQTGGIAICTAGGTQGTWTTIT